MIDENMVKFFTIFRISLQDTHKIYYWYRKGIFSFMFALRSKLGRVMSAVSFQEKKQWRKPHKEI